MAVDVLYVNRCRRPPSADPGNCTPVAAAVKKRGPVVKPTKPTSERWDRPADLDKAGM